jgi:hypothetical protein
VYDGEQTVTHSTQPTKERMKNTIKLTLAASAVAVLAACGGGGGGGGGGYLPVTYTEFGGLKWSSTTSEVVIYPSGFFVGLEKDASEYCTQQTCDNDQYGKTVNCRATNFNGELGWTLPSREQLQSFYAANPRPTGWVIGPVWTSRGGESLDFRNGSWTNSGQSISVKAHATCVKKI